MDPPNRSGPLIWVALLAVALGAVVVAMESTSADLPEDAGAVTAQASAPPADPRPAALPVEPDEEPPPDNLQSVHGRVVEEGSTRGVADARVQLGTGSAAKTDSSGAFVLRVPHGASGKVHAEADGYLSADVPLVDGQPLQIRLERTTLIKVRVVKPNKGGVANARVEVSPPLPPRSHRADERGEARITGVKPGRYQLTGRSADGAEAGWAEVAVAPRQHVSITLTLSPAGAVEGRVVEADGTAAPGAQVWAATPDGAVLASSVSSADGVFLLRGLPTVDEVQVHASRSGRHGRSENVRPARGGVTRGVLITLEKGVDGIAGVVLDDDGSPATGATVELAPARAMDGTAWASVSTDADGRFSFEAVADRSYDLTARQGDLEAVADDVRPGSRNITLHLSTRTMIEGRAVDESGHPVARFQVTADFARDHGPRHGARVRRGGSRSATVNNPAGQFSVGPVKNGQYELEVVTDDGRLGRATADVRGRQSVNVGDITVRGAGRVVGRVIDKRSGMPVAGASVTRAAFGAQTAITGDDGRFSLAVPPGHTALLVQHPAYFAKQVPVGSAEVNAAPVDVGDVLLVPGSRKEIEGRNGFGGVGAVLREDSGKVLIDRVLGDGPATRAGLRQGDVVLAVDGDESNVRGVQEAVSNLRGESGSTVWIKVKRGDQVLELPIRREPISFDGRR